MTGDKIKPRAFAKHLRTRMTDAETILWSRLRHNAVYGRRFRRQHPVGPYIADFACLPMRLIVEVDGATHGSEAERQYDHRRDAYLYQRGWRVLRFWNTDIYENLDSVIDRISDAVSGTDNR
jgi:very-short-patch-repair endonuclease